MLPNDDGACAGGEESDAKRRSIDQNQQRSDFSKHHIGELIETVALSMPSPIFTGTFSIPISAMREPPADLKVRDVKQ